MHRDMKALCALPFFIFTQFMIFDKSIPLHLSNQV